MSSPTVAIHACVDYRDRPFRRPCDCSHPNEMVLPINLRSEPVGRGRRREIVADGFICLDCGDDRSGQLGLVDGLTAAFHAARAIFPLAMRVHTLVEHRRADLDGYVLPTWMAAPLGLLPPQFDRYNRTVRALLALEYLGRRIARRQAARIAAAAAECAAGFDALLSGSAMRIDPHAAPCR